MRHAGLASAYSAYVSAWLAFGAAQALNLALNLMTLLEAVAAMPVHHTKLSDGATVRYRQAGLNSSVSAAPTIVLLHGIGSGSASWVRQLTAVQPQAVCVLAWDAPGYADSSPVAAAQPVAADYAQRLGLWLDALGVLQAHIVGHSLGCIMAASFAKLYPHRVSQLTLLAPAQGYGAADTDIPSSVHLCCSAHTPILMKCN